MKVFSVFDRITDEEVTKDFLIDSLGSIHHKVHGVNIEHTRYRLCWQSYTTSVYGNIDGYTAQWQCTAAVEQEE